MSEIIIWLAARNGDIVAQSTIPFEWITAPQQVSWSGRVFDKGLLGRFHFGGGGPPLTYSEITAPYALTEVVAPDPSLDKPYTPSP